MYERWGKRAFDIAGAALLLLVAAPLPAAAALGVLAVLGRPVLFRQARTGRGGATFTLLKLRSLRDGPGEDAARLGRFGRVLRASAVDELPQLVNVLRGEMSLVGPRPLLPEYRALYTPAQARRLRVRPGLCGLAQAAGRNAVPWGTRLALDARCAVLVLRGVGVSAPGEATMPRFRGEAARWPGRPGRVSRPAPARAAPRPAPSPAPSAAAPPPSPRPAGA